MKKANTPSYILTLKLKTNARDIVILNKRFSIAAHLYNSLLNEALKRIHGMQSSREYIETGKRIKEFHQCIKSCKDKKKAVFLKKELNALYKEKNRIQSEAGLTEYALINAMTPMRTRFSKNMDNKTAQALAKRIWSAVNKYLNGNGEKLHFQRRDQFYSVEGLWNASGIRYLKDEQVLVWNKLRIPVIIKKKDDYAKEALLDKVKYCRIIREKIKGNDVFYVQLVLEGIPPKKCDRETGELKNPIGFGSVGIDIGTSTVAVVGETDVKLCELASKVKSIEKEKRRIQRKMDRSRRATNPDNFNEDGTIKRQGSKKVFWMKSKKYLKLQGRLREIQRKQAAVRKYQHECLTNEILSIGDVFYVEEMNLSGLAKRAKKTEKSEKTGKFKKKKRFGKSIGNRAPAMLLTILDRKLHYYGKELIKINTWKAKASQYDHYTGEYKKKPLSKRWNEINGVKVQRDLYSAYLIKNINEDLETFHEEKCQEGFGRFLEMHDREIGRLTGHQNLSCMGI